MKKYNTQTFESTLELSLINYFTETYIDVKQGIGTLFYNDNHTIREWQLVRIWNNWLNYHNFKF